jgi:hypothetical protein
MATQLKVEPSQVKSAFSYINGQTTYLNRDFLRPDFIAKYGNAVERGLAHELAHITLGADETQADKIAEELLKK